MKRPNFTLKNLLTLVSENIKTTTRAFSIVLTFTLIYSVTHAQNCNVILSCNDGVQISLDEDCNMYIEPDMVLEGPAYPDEYYDVEAKLPNGTSLPQVIVANDYLGRPIKRVAINNSHIGLALQVKVSLRGCANSCWGTANIEDKLPPVITSCPCEERITRFEGEIPGSSLTYERPIASICDPMGVGSYQTSDYIVFQFAVDVTGIVDINMTQTDAVFNLYQTSFDRLNPCTNRISLNTRTFSGPLSAGVNYFLVVSSITDLPAFMNININTLFIDSRVGNVKTSAASSSIICTRACTQEAALLAQTAATASNRPVFTDNCSNSNKLTYTKSDSVEVLECSDRYAKIVRRQWTATDSSGNVSDVKTQYFYINRGSLAAIMCPEDWIRNCDVLSSPSYEVLPNGAPHPRTSGSPENIGCSNIQVFYDDIIFDLCGAGIKVFRQWTILDWCTGQDTICPQTIKIHDSIPPAFICPVIPNISASSSCLGNWQVTPPTATDCSLITWDVFFSKDGTNLLTAPVDAIFIKVDATTTISGSSPAFATQINTSPSPFNITGLPFGKTWIKYVVKDECGNIRECITSVTVVDKTPPTAICEDETVISIDDTGWAELYAQSLDDHSTDNCGPIVKFEVRRKTTTCAGYTSDLEFGPKVRFCCSDITAPVSYITVVLRVYDAAGNYNECETTVKVQNKRPPAINCPSGRTLNCGDPRIAPWISGNLPFDTVYFGKPTVSGVCSDLQFRSRILPFTLDKCGKGSIRRKWMLISDTTITCEQVLTITSPPFSSSDVVLNKLVIQLPSCDVEDANPDVLIDSKPVVSNLACRDIGISFTDQTFYGTQEACIKILRVWRIIDWCSYQSTPVIVEITQTIKLMGTNAPVVTCNNGPFTTDTDSCEKEVTLSANVSGGCGIEVRWTLDINKDGIDESGLGSSFTRILPAGTHRVTFTATNICGIATTCSQDVIVRSSKKPTPVCYAELTWVMDQSGTTVVWANDFIQSSSTNLCGLTTDLEYYMFRIGESVNFTVANQSKTFRCVQDIPNGQVNRIPLLVYVRDKVSGSFDFCNVTLILQDSPLTNACTDIPDLLPTVAGRITTEKSEGLDQVEVALTNISNSSEKTEMTGNQGEYMFSGVDVFDPKSISAYNNGNILNGVSTLDLVLIQRHILGIQKIESPYKLLAADINNSRNVTASDLVNLRKLILGITLDFENNTSWRFVPSEYIFQDAAFPFDFPSKINLDSIFEDKTNVNFTAVKVGDVNSSALANINSVSTEKRSSSALFTTELKSFEAGNTVRQEIKAGDIMEIMGAQFALNFDTDQLAFSSIEGGKFDIKTHHINALQAESGKIYFSFDIPKGINLKADDILFIIEYKSLSDGNTSSIKLDQSTLSAEVYEMDASVRPLHLQTRDRNAEGAQNILYQNEPNPFKDFTNISFELSKSSNVVIRVVDVTGKVVFSHKGQFGKGYNTITVSNNQLANSGVYYYQIEAGEFSATKKMILIE